MWQGELIGIMSSFKLQRRLQWPLFSRGKESRYGLDSLQSPQSRQTDRLLLYFCFLSLASGFHTQGRLRIQKHCWSSSHQVPNPAAGRRVGERQKGCGPTGCSHYLGVFLEVPPTNFCFYLIGQDLVTWPHLFAYKAGEYSLYWSQCHLNVVKIPLLKRNGKNGNGYRGGTYICNH